MRVGYVYPGYVKSSVLFKMMKLFQKIIMPNDVTGFVIFISNKTLHEHYTRWAYWAIIVMNFTCKSLAS